MKTRHLGALATVLISALGLEAAACSGFGSEDETPNLAEADGGGGGGEGGDLDGGTIGNSGKPSFALGGPSAPLPVSRGDSVKVSVVVTRTTPSGYAPTPVTLTVATKDGISAAPVTVPPDAGGAELEISVGASVPIGAASIEIVADGGAAGNAALPVDLVIRGAHGEVDTSFAGSTNGTSTNTVGLGTQRIQVLADDSIVVGHLPNDRSKPFSLIKFRPDGSRDTTFAAAMGKVDVAVAGSAFEFATMPDGSFMLVVLDTSSITVVHVLANGGLDSNFGAGGKVVEDASVFRPYSDDPSIVLSASSPNSIVVANSWMEASQDVGGWYALGFDRATGTRNVQQYGGFLGPTSRLHRIVSRSDGYLLLGQTADFSSTVLQKLDKSFKSDTTYGTNATRVLTNSGNRGSLRASAILPNGDFLVAHAAKAGASSVLSRLPASGVGWDATFGASGNLVLPKVTGAIALRADGWFYALQGVLDDWDVVRIAANGVVDATFQTGSARFPTLQSAASGLVQQKDGRLVVLGLYSNGQEAGFYLHRLWD